MADTKTKRNVLLAVLIVGLMAYGLWSFIGSGDDGDKTAKKTSSKRSKAGTRGSTRRRAAPRALDLLPDNTLAVLSVRNGADLAVGLKRLGLVRWMSESGLEAILGARAGAAAAAAGGPLGERMATLGDDARALPARLGKLMPGTTVLAIAGWHDDGATMPIPQLLLISEVSKEVDDDWIDAKLDELASFYGTGDKNKDFSHSRLHHTTGDDDYLYHRIGDDVVRFNVIRDGRHLIISNHKPLFHEILDRKHGGSGKGASGERRPPGVLVETAPFLQVAERCPPGEQDIFLFVQSRHLAQLMRQTLPVDDDGLRCQHYSGWLSAEAFGYGWKADGYAQRETAFALYEAGLPQDALLSGLGGLKSGGDLAARVPPDAVAAWHGHLDGDRWLDIARRVSRNLIREGSADVPDVNGMIEGLRALAFPLDRVAEALSGEATAWLSVRAGQPSAGALLTIQSGFQPRLSSWISQLGGALERSGRGSMTVSDDGTVHLAWSRSSAANGPVWADLPPALRPVALSLENDLCGNLYIAMNKNLLLIATSADEMAAIRDRLQAKKKPWGNPDLQGAWGRVDGKSRASFWVDTRRLVRAAQLPLSALDGFNAVEDLEPLIPPLMVRLRVVGLEGRRKDGAPGILVEGFGPAPVLGMAACRGVISAQLARLFGPIEPANPGP